MQRHACSEDDIPSTSNVVRFGHAPPGSSTSKKRSPLSSSDGTCVTRELQPLPSAIGLLLAGTGSSGSSSSKSQPHSPSSNSSRAAATVRAGSGMSGGNSRWAVPIGVTCVVLLLLGAQNLNAPASGARRPGRRSLRTTSSVRLHGSTAGSSSDVIDVLAQPESDWRGAAARAGLSASVPHYGGEGLPTGTPALRSFQLPNGRHRHQEAGYGVWKDLLVVAGGFNTTLDESKLLKGDCLVNAMYGVPVVSILNLTSMQLFEGPPLPIPVNHNGLVITPAGKVHVVGSSLFAFKVFPTAHPKFRKLVSEEPGKSEHFVLDLPAWLAAHGPGSTAGRMTGSTAGSTGASVAEAANGRAGQQQQQRAQDQPGQQQAHPSVLGAADSGWWVPAAPMPGSWGGHQCAVLGTNMYCVGGSRAAPILFTDALMIYDLAADTWTEGPPAPVQTDHVAVMEHNGLFWLIGGQYAWDGGDVARRKASNTLHKGGAYHFVVDWGGLWAFDPADRSDPKQHGRWIAYQPLPRARSTIITAPVPRRRTPTDTPSTTFVALGGQSRRGSNVGIATNLLEEYWVETDSWFCHPPLPFNLFGGAAAWSDALGALVVLGGSEAFYLSSIDSVYVLDLALLPDPQPCMYSQTHSGAWWRDEHKISMMAGQFPFHRRFLQQQEDTL